MKLLAVIASVITISSFSSVYAEPIILEQVSPSGILIKLEWPEVYPDEIYNFKVSFYDSNTGELLDDIRLNYNIKVLQHDHPVEIYEHNLATDGTGNFDVMFPEESEGPAQIIVELKESSDHGIPTTYNEEITFSVNVVPEFGVIAAVILAASLVPILLLSKSKLSKIQ